MRRRHSPGSGRLASLLLLLATAGAALGEPMPLRFERPRVIGDENLAGVSGTGVNALAFDGFGFLWVGTNEGLLRFDGVESTTVGRSQPSRRRAGALSENGDREPVSPPPR